VAGVDDVVAGAARGDGAAKGVEEMVHDASVGEVGACSFGRRCRGCFGGCLLALLIS